MVHSIQDRHLTAQRLHCKQGLQNPGKNSKYTMIEANDRSPVEISARDINPTHMY